MKKLTAIVIILTLLLSLAACGGKDDNNSKETSNESTVSETDESSETSLTESEENSSEESSTAGSEDESSDASDSDSSEEESSGTETSSPALEGSLEDILAAVYTGVEGIEELTLSPEYLVTTAIDPNDCFYYFGVNTLDFKEGIASEPEMGGGYSLCLIRANSPDDVAGLKETIAANVDPYKWVCMGVEDDKVVVDSIGDVVILIMYDQSEYLHQAFLDLSAE